MSGYIDCDYIYTDKKVAQEISEVCRYNPLTSALSHYIDFVFQNNSSNSSWLPLKSKNIQPFYVHLLSARLNSNFLLNHLILSKNNDLSNRLISIATPSQLNLIDRDGAPLHCACLKESYDIAQRILYRSANPSIKSPKQETPLHIAASKGNNNFIQLLINHNANPCEQDSKGNIPLHIAVMNLCVETVKVLARNSCLNIQNFKGKTPLHIAAQVGNQDMIEHLLKLGADRNIVDLRGCTPFHIAAFYGHSLAVKLLMQTMDNFARQNDARNTPYISAILRGYSNIVQDLPDYHSKEILIRKAIAHIFSIEGDTQTGSLYPIRLQGFAGQGWVDFLIPIIDNSFNQGVLPIRASDHKQIIDMLSFYKKSLRTSPKSILERLESAQPTLIPFGYKTHEVTLLIIPETVRNQIDHYKFIIANRGAFSNGAVEIFSVLNTKNINTRTIKDIIEINNTNKNEYLSSRHNILNKIEARKTEEDSYVSHSFKLTNQEASNCSWVSLVSSLWPYLSYCFRHERDWLSKTNFFYDQIEEYSKIFILNKWLEHNSEDQCREIPAVLNQALSKLNRSSFNNFLKYQFDEFTFSLMDFTTRFLRNQQRNSTTSFPADQYYEG